MKEYSITTVNGKEFAKGGIIPTDAVFNSSGYFGGSLELSCEDIERENTSQTVLISGISEPDLITLPRNLVLFANREPTAELTLVGNAVNSIEDIVCSPELAEMLDCELDRSILRVTYKQKGGVTDNKKKHYSGKITIMFDKILPNTVVREHCTVRVMVVL